ncbi:MAG: SAM-dependent methyltransferase [Sphingobacteriia bacterium]|nr:SAM-dependent methyltransferase [Sphingobacteriia bacterium]NCC40124.1 SAM-dependent methyltransferase [Gammaproteobacteria bacterium]
MDHTRPSPTDNSRAASASAQEISRRLEQLIREEIAAAAGLLPFDRFMDLALYAPGLGYYVAGAAKLGPDGDFVTAPEISPLFGRCLANHCIEVLERLGGGDLIELGAGSGTLAVQLLETLESRAALPKRYRILEPSPDLQERQQRLIEARIPHLANRCEWLSELPTAAQGLIIANEVMDAMPVHRFRIAANGLPEELFVSNRQDTLIEVHAPARSPGLAEAVADLRATGLACAPGYRSEINLRLAPWLRALGAALTRGALLLIDYGYPRREYYQADRDMGTLVCYRRHQAHANPYLAPGLQDITAHVDFTAVVESAHTAGFMLDGFTTQANFLIACGIDRLIAEAPGQPELSFGAKQLLLPSAMGERYKVMGLSKDLDGDWSGFQGRDLSDRL